MADLNDDDLFKTFKTSEDLSDILTKCFIRSIPITSHNSQHPGGLPMPITLPLFSRREQESPEQWMRWGEHFVIPINIRKPHALGDARDDPEDGQKFNESGGLAYLCVCGEDARIPCDND